jgi:uncharacterized protein (TIGR02268 family)
MAVIPFSGSLLLLSLLSANDVPAAQPPCAQEKSIITLDDQAVDGAPVACVGRSSVTLVAFDTPIDAAFVVEYKLARVTFDGRLLTFFIVDKVELGTELHLEVRFESDMAPRLATIRMLVHSSEVARQVEVRRRPRTLDSYQEEVADLRLKNGQLQSELAQLRGPAHRGADTATHPATGRPRSGGEDAGAGARTAGTQ